MKLPGLSASISAAALLVSTLTGCGGGDSAPTTAAAPPVGQKVDFAVTDTDNSHNTIPWTLEYTVVSSAPDGSYTQSAIGNGADVAVNGTVYGRIDQIDDYNAQHHLTSYTNEGATPVTCSFAQPRIIVPPGAVIGVPWPPFNDTSTCTNGTQYATSVQNGLYVDIENLTVPAGTFSTKKMQYDITRTDTTSGAATTGHVTIWYDVVSGREVQSSTDYTYADRTFAAGYLTHEQLELLTAP
jgi:hypothetical protein